MKKLASALGFLAIVSSSLPGNAPAAVTAQSCNYYTGISVTGQKVNLDTCSISKSSDRDTNFVYYLGDKKFASKANCSDRTWTTLSNKQVNTPQSQATKKMLDRVCNEQISSNSSTEEKTESTSGERSIAQANDRSLNYYEDDLIKARGLSAAFVNDAVTVNILVENKSGKDLLLTNTHGVYVVVTSDSGQSTTQCGLTGIKDSGVNGADKNPEIYSRLKQKGRLTISATNCQGLDPTSTNSVSFNIDLTVYGKDSNTKLAFSLVGIPAKKIKIRK